MPETTAAVYIVMDLDHRSAMHFQLIGRMLSDDARWHRFPWIEDPYYWQLAERAAKACGMTDYLVQREPCRRVHPPGGAGEPWHTDAAHGHHWSEWNVWVPLTEITDDTQVIWLADDEGETFPAPVRVGEALVFNGGSRAHGSFENASEAPRISFDFRLLPWANYQPGGRTVKYGVPMTLGEYWAKP